MEENHTPEGVENFKPDDEIEEQGGDHEKFDDENELMMQLSELDSSTTPITAELKVTESETLAASETDLQSECIPSSHLLSEVPVEYTLQPPELAEFKSQVRVNQQQALVSVTTQTDQVHLLNNVQVTGSIQTPSLEMSPTSVTRPILSVPSPALHEQRASPLGNSNGICMAEVNKKSSSDSKIVSAKHIAKASAVTKGSGSYYKCTYSEPIAKASAFDGFNWRKYGQKQVKSPEGSRSYYKCTYSDCYAKKIECCDSSSSVKEIVYKGHHNHDPPPSINCTRERKAKRPTLSVVPIVGSTNISHPVSMVNSTDAATSSEETIQENIPVPETKQQNSSGSDGNSQMNDMEEHDDEPEPKRRVKKSSSADPDVFKTGKTPKIVVHAASDVGISADGYRWRKYGQKIVKGTPHPRNYYRCTSAGCPVRKHIEIASDNTNAQVITYKGVHDHDMPVPKKRHGQPSAPLLAAAAPASMNNLQTMKPEMLPNELSATQWSVDKEGELTGDRLGLGEEKPMESTPTLLSIDFEIKPC